MLACGLRPASGLRGVSHILPQLYGSFFNLGLDGLPAEKGMVHMTWRPHTPIG
jgi:hypothetical protein